MALAPVGKFRMWAALAADASLWQRLAYPFAHANFLHAAVNAWCLLSLVFSYNVSSWQCLAAYAIAVAVPSFVLTAQPVVGLSGVCFALIGLMSFSVRRRLYYQAWAAAALAIAFFFSNAAALLHLWCYAMGVLMAALTTPIAQLRNPSRAL